MKKFRIVRGWNSNDDIAWDLLATSALGPSVHPSRKKGFCLAREALRLILAEEGVELEIPELVFKNYHELLNLPQYTLSLSHSKEIGAALVAHSSVYRSVGIDVEHQDRVVKPQILERVSHAQDIKLGAIDLWCLKEAVFKAVMNTHCSEKPVEFSGLVIEDKTWRFEPFKLEGQWSLSFFEQHVVAQAWLPV